MFLCIFKVVSLSHGVKRVWTNLDCLRKVLLKVKCKCGAQLTRILALLKSKQIS